LALRNLLAVLLTIVVLALGAARGEAAPHLLVDMGSGKVLSQQDAFDRWYPASLTKLMTAYTVFDEVRRGRISLQSPVAISQKALSMPPSKMGFPVGSVMTVDAALKMLMVKSANDIAMAIAESVGGSEAAFVAMMNANARKLGMRDSNFVNPHGLHDPAQFSSARDLAVLGIALRKEFPKYNGYYSIPAIQAGKKVLQNHNALLQRFDGTTGMKTGFVCASGLNIVATAQRNGKHLLVVVLGGPSGKERNVRAARLLTEGFRKSALFINQKIDSMQPTGRVNRVPVDMRPIACAKRKKGENEEEEQENPLTLAFAAREPTLDELEAIYLKPKGHNTRIIPVTLGGAVGPDPFGLVKGGQPGAEAVVSGDWPMVFGTKNVRVPVPVARPLR
jgi:D-alanyl-D-alanine carboxypeptidase